MQIHFGVDLFRPEWQSSVVCIGTFDGVHLGHAAVIKAAVARAEALGQPSVLVTFDRHPAAILAPDRKPPAIGTLNQNLKHFEELGVDCTVILPFNKDLANTPADAFFEAILLSKLKAKEVVVGHDFAFGKDRVGNGVWLAERIPTQVVPPFQIDSHRVSSSDIRRAIQAGEVEKASQWLGRPFCFEGIVVDGEKLGRTLGFPTANLARTGDQVLPGFGVYAGIAHTQRGSYQTGISVGVRPTFGEHALTVEAYLLDYPGDSLYGSALKLDFLKKLRSEARFDSAEALKEQMALDIEAVRALR